MITAKQLISSHVIHCFPEQRLSSVAGEMARHCAEYCVVLEPADHTVVGMVHLCEIAGRVNVASRIFADLMKEPPEQRVSAEQSATVIAELFANTNAREILVVGTHDEFVGLITARSFSVWLLASERKRRAELQEILEERKQLADFLEKKVNRRMDEIRRTLDEFDRLAMTMSHDIRGPLTSICSFADILLNGEGGVLTDDGRESALRIQRCATKLTEMADELLVRARKLASDNPAPFSTVDLNEVLNDTLEFLDTQIKRQRARVVCGGKLHPIRGYYVSALQVFINLLSNALKFSPSGVDPLIEIWTEEENEVVMLSIKDNGIGVAAEDQDKIFEPFTSRRSEAYPGTGLGLMITKQAVADLNGHVTVSSTQGAGTLFRLQLWRAAS